MLEFRLWGRAWVAFWLTRHAWRVFFGSQRVRQGYFFSFSVYEFKRKENHQGLRKVQKSSPLLVSFPFLKANISSS